MLDAKQKKAVDKALNIIRESIGTYGVMLNTPDIVKSYLVCKLAKSEREQFLVLFLDSRHRLITDEVLFEGTIDAAGVYPREIVKAALKHNAGAVILAHNHPSGVPDPSNADKHITQRIVRALETVEIRTLDHFIVAGANTLSFAEKGLL